jgi:hypothetical protein
VTDFQTWEPYEREAVYFVQAKQGGPIKIGVSSDVPKRIRAIQTTSPAELLVLRVIPSGGRELERKLHESFAAHRLHGEWFEPAQELLDYIRDLSGDVEEQSAEETRQEYEREQERHRRVEEALNEMLDELLGTWAYVADECPWRPSRGALSWLLAYYRSHIVWEAVFFLSLEAETLHRNKWFDKARRLCEAAKDSSRDEAFLVMYEHEHGPSPT